VTGQPHSGQSLEDVDLRSDLNTFVINRKNKIVSEPLEKYGLQIFKKRRR
jgi:hypothetical protein